MPAAMSASTCSGDEDAGPIVATIFVRLGLTDAMNGM
jgi:hypothetical protein